MFLLQLKERFKLTQGAVQNLIHGVTALHKERAIAQYTKVCQVLSSAGIDLTSVPGLDNLFGEDGVYRRPFLGLETKYLQEKYYKTHFHIAVRKRQ